MQLSPFAKRQRRFYNTVEKMCTATCSSTLTRQPPPPSAANADAEYEGRAATGGELHTDILQFHILTRLDGPTLAAASCVSSRFRTLSTEGRLWADICRSTWPSTDDPRLQEVIAAFPNGHRSFFSDSYPLPAVPSVHNSRAAMSRSRSSPTEIISAVDIHYRGKLVFSQTVVTETVTGWFRCSPFRIDMLEPKDVVPTPVPYPGTDDACRGLGDDLALSWIVVDPSGRRAADVSSRRPVSVSRHWLSGEVHARFGAVVAGEGKGGSSSELVQCGVVVTCGGSHGGVLQVREVSLQVEDMDGMFLNGRDSLVILQGALEGRRGKSAGGAGEGKRAHEEFLRMKRARKERKLRAEGTLDMLCVAFGVLLIALFLWVFISRS